MFKSDRFFLMVVSIVMFSLFLVGCGNGEENQPQDEVVTDENEGLYIVTSFSILNDVVSEIIGDRGTVDYIVPIGEEPHEYEPIPSDFQKVSDADVFYINGFNLEEWLEGLVQNVGDVPTVEVTESITPIKLEGGDVDDPHSWMNVTNVITKVETIVNDLVERDPEGEEVYRENAAAYIEELEELDGWIAEQVEQIPEDMRVIVVSEDAFKYFGEAYGMETEGIWELNSHEEGTPSQMSRVVDVVRDRQLPAIFVETTVSRSYMETVSDNTGVDIAGEVYTDAVGVEGSGAETYIKMMEHNVNTFVDGLTQ
ncbi:metal ABC transporter substrate-binding protein [Desertibacillus haloalkaliphilus]|uniref:metal ABC transporter substrate-binding protein n=1 Tax=Desertibacillus haloalkaliphilus TaxID=1328930 RepID=UPI001C278082|nr:metal ABC transporter substrate-binding protein [Desertibacillus haloalkaliphilus]MBU8908771.1 metal ABC transporter substrate-binding protein [Desertibacillus haloalkaliphilus]